VFDRPGSGVFIRKGTELFWCGTCTTNQRGYVMIVRAIICGVLLATTGSLGAGEKITMRASPEVSFAPAHLTVRTNIEADADNRAVEIVIDSPDFYRSSTIQLEGELAPRTSVVEFRAVPGGNYMISARLLDQSGETRAYARRMVNVIAQEGER
jgi:hypothetical protein